MVAGITGLVKHNYSHINFRILKLQNNNTISGSGILHNEYVSKQNRIAAAVGVCVCVCVCVCLAIAGK